MPSPLPVPGCTAETTVRKPVWAGRFYPANPQELDQLVQHLIATADAEAADRPLQGDLRAVIMPHAGFIYSGLTAAHAAREIPRERFRHVVLLGPDHRVGFRNAAVTGATHWRTPLGLIPIADGSRLVGARPDLFARIAPADRQEHSLEVTLPFLQARLSNFELLPLVIGPCDAEEMARMLVAWVETPSTLVVVSADLSHYLPEAEAVERDRQTLARIRALDPGWEADQHNRTCGRYPVGVLLALARRYGWTATVLHTSNSGRRTGDPSTVVGYAAVAFYGEKPMQKNNPNGKALSSRQGAALVTLARQTLARHFGRRMTPEDAQALENNLADPALQACCGTFVTLKIDNQLRGCIGSLSGRAPLVSGVRDNALNAAFHDPRFSPLSEKELDRVHIEVSVLSEPEPLSYADADDLVAKLRPGIDGVIIKKGYASATFLPQVWEQLPRPESFLAHLCMKAGLPADQWRAGDLEVLIYQVQYFEEAQ